jgi:hypothetical protein
MRLDGNHSSALADPTRKHQRIFSVTRSNVYDHVAFSWTIVPEPILFGVSGILPDLLPPRRKLTVKVVKP